MKKLLLIVFVLAICVLAFPQGVLAAPVDKGVIVNAVYENSQLTFTANTVSARFPWTLIRDDHVAPPVYNANLNPGALTFTVDSVAPWTVNAADDKAGVTKGHMIEAASGGTHYLAQHFQLRNTTDATQYTLDTTNPQVQTGNPSLTAFTMDIAQPLLAADHDWATGTLGYTITVKFTCANGFT